MAIDFNKRTRMLAGAAVIAAGAAGAGAYFLYFDEPPPPPPVAVKSAPKPAAVAASKGAVTDAAKPAADAPKQAIAGKPTTKPVPTDPDQAVAEFLDSTGATVTLQQTAKEIPKGGQFKDPAAAAEFSAILERVFEPKLMMAEVSTNLKAGYDGGRMARYLELRRQPIVVKMTAMETAMLELSADERKALMDELDKNPLPPARAKIVARLDELRRSAGLGGEIGAVLGRGYVEGVLDHLQTSRNGKAGLTQVGNGDPRNARPVLMAQVEARRKEQIKMSGRTLSVRYRDASEAELSEYLKLIDTEIGEWGAATLGAALKPVFDKRGREQGRAFAQFAFDGKQVASAAPVPGPVAQARAAPMEKPADKPVVVQTAVAAPVEQPGYRRAANVREVYSRYNDVMTATVMRDRGAVKELLDDGKNPNARQSDGATALMIASSNGDTEIATLLLAKGADPNLRAGGR
ncbi:MAG: ankyrin repeat domain-containing protein, partial [Candidatus Parcubacteria bacterium]|nr:ankyrin repeat domain-containing protein [Burkholderiales bacterium]